MSAEVKLDLGAPVTLLYIIGGNELRYKHGYVLALNPEGFVARVTAIDVTYESREYGTWWIHGHHDADE